MSSTKDAIMSEFDGIVEGSEIYYDAALDYKGDAPEGTYPAHISNLNIKENIEIKRSKSVADILEVFVTIADAAKSLEFPVDPKDSTKGKISGALFAGREYKSKGIFVFKNPPEHLKNQGYTVNPGGNGSARAFCENIGLELEIAEERESGNHLYKLPPMTLNEMQGLPVLINLAKRYWKDSKGEAILSERDSTPMYSMEVVSFLPWEAGTKKDFSYGEDIPF